MSDTNHPNFNNIQGNILRGFNKDNSRLIFFQIEDAQKASDWFAEMVEQKKIVSTQDLIDAAINMKEREELLHQKFKPRETWIHVAFPASGLKKFGLKLPPSKDAYGYEETEISPGKKEMVIKLINGQADAGDDPFKVGMHHKKGKLGDVGNNDPSNWVKPFKPIGSPPDDFPPIDGLLRVDSDEPEDADQTAVDLIVESTERGIISKGLQKGTGILNIHGKQIEHFGFRDGVSQPLIRGIDDVPPLDTEFKSRKINKDDHDFKKFVLFGLKDDREWANDGSFMVFRRLEQDFEAFWTFMNENSQRFGLTPSGLAARFVGRWRSGAPLAKFQTGDPELPSEFDFNDFKYMQDPRTTPPTPLDPQGRDTPRFAHIRKVYPRDDGISSNPEDNNLRNQERRILRRGIPYGPRFADNEKAERGLLFMCFQIDLDHQFEFIQKTWASNKNFPLTTAPPPPPPGGHGIDAIIGKGDENPPGSGSQELGFTNLFKDGTNPSFERIPPPPQNPNDPPTGFAQWITTTGGVYLFSPSMPALKKMKV